MLRSEGKKIPIQHTFRMKNRHTRARECVFWGGVRGEEEEEEEEP